MAYTRGLYGISIPLLYYDLKTIGRGSSVVERTIGNGEAESSILSRGTIYFLKI